MMNTKSVIAIILLFPLFTTILAQEVNLSREKSMRLLLKLDSFILHYKEKSVKTTDSLNAGNYQSQMLKLFESPNTIIFDDINPNIEKRRETWIVEKEKPALQYLHDADSTYGNLNCNITWTNLGNATRRLYYSNKEMYVPVAIKKELRGYTQGKHSAYFATNSKLNLLIHIKDTINFPLAISSISKTSPTSTEWQYNPPVVRQRRIQAIFSLRPVATYFLNYPSFKNMNPEIEYISFREQTEGINAKVAVSYGVTAEFAFRFILGRSSYKNWGFYTGVGGGSYNVKFTSDLFSCVDYEEDKDHDKYYRISEIKNLVENWKFYTLDVPFQLSFERWKEKNPYKGRYFRIGGRFSYFPLTEFKTDQMNTQQGYYPEYNLLLKNIDEYYFHTDKKLEKYPGTFNTYQYNIAPELAFGKMHRSKRGGIIFYYGINLTGYFYNFFDSDADTELFTNEYKYNSILATIKEGRLIYCGFTIGIRRANKNEILLLPKKIKYLNN